jgi:hypothetical protein
MRLGNALEYSSENGAKEASQTPRSRLRITIRTRSRFLSGTSRILSSFHDTFGTVAFDLWPERLRSSMMVEWLRHRSRRDLHVLSVSHALHGPPYSSVAHTLQIVKGTSIHDRIHHLPPICHFHPVDCDLIPVDEAGRDGIKVRHNFD